MEVKGHLMEEKENAIRTRTIDHCETRIIEQPLQDLMQKLKDFNEKRQNLTRTRTESSKEVFILNQNDSRYLISS